MTCNKRPWLSRFISYCSALCSVLVVATVGADVISPEDHPPRGQEAPASMHGVQDYFGSLERQGNLLHTTTPWSMDTPLQGQLNLGIRQNLTARIIEYQGGPV